MAGYIPDWVPLIGTRKKFDEAFGTDYAGDYQRERQIGLDEKKRVADEEEYTRLKAILREQAHLRADKYKKFIKDRPTITNTYENFMKEVDQDKINFKKYSKEDWDKKYEDRASSPGAFYKNRTISYPEGTSMEKMERMIPHESLHYFASHKPGMFGVPEELTRYQKADQKLKGWLPNIRPGRRPRLPGETPLGKWWNENMATKDTDYSNKREYHPAFDEHYFDTALEDKTKINWKDWGGGTLSQKTKQVADMLLNR